MTEFYFIRHGESQANVDGVVAGWQDSPLTDEGIRQANIEAAGVRTSGIHFAMIVSSPLVRAYDTAKIVAEVNGYPIENIVALDSLKEKKSGTFEGRPPQELFDASDEDVVRAGAENFDDFAARVRRANTEIARVAFGTTLIVGHSGFYRMALCLARHVPPSDMTRMEKPMNGKLMQYPLEEAGAA